MLFIENVPDEALSDEAFAPGCPPPKGAFPEPVVMDGADGNCSPSAFIHSPVLFESGSMYLTADESIRLCALLFLLPYALVTTPYSRTSPVLVVGCRSICVPNQRPSAVFCSLLLRCAAQPFFKYFCKLFFFCSFRAGNSVVLLVPRRALQRVALCEALPVHLLECRHRYPQIVPLRFFCVHSVPMSCCLVLPGAKAENHCKYKRIPQP